LTIASTSGDNDIAKSSVSGKLSYSMKQPLSFAEIAPIAESRPFVLEFSATMH
jgi:hypothetical protein